MKYFVDSGDLVIEVAIERVSGAEGRFRVCSEMVTEEIEVRTVGPNAATIRAGGTVSELSFEDGDGRVIVRDALHRYTLVCRDEREMEADRVARTRQRKGAGTVRAIMPGIVRRLFVEVGAEVSEGQSLLILEAMKMENEVRAEMPGRVAKLHVAMGDTVETDAPLVEIIALAEIA